MQLFNIAVRFSGPIAHPDNYREVRAPEMFEFIFFGPIAHPDNYREVRAPEMFEFIFFGPIAQMVSST
jgi:hypothetical protein